MVALSLLILGLVLGPAASAAAGEAARLVLVTSHSAAPYEQAGAGLRQGLKQQGIELPLATVALDGDAARAGQALEEAQRRQSPAVVVFGTLGMRGVLSATRTVPVVGALFLRREDLQGASNATGVALELSADTHLTWLKRFLPQARAVGVMYSPDNRGRVHAVARAAERYGVQITGVEIQAPRDIPGALERLARQAEVLWGISDPMVLNNETAKEILLFSYRNRIPFVGPSASWAKAGALYALDWDYADLGAQAAEQVARVLRGASPGDIPVAAPRKVPYAVNQRAASHAKLDIPSDLLRNAREVF